MSIPDELRSYRREQPTDRLVDELPGGPAAPRTLAGRFHLYREAVEIALGENVSWGDAAILPDDGCDVVSIFGIPLFPAHLWVYTNYDCNCACGYCSVGSNPRVARRSIGAGRFERLVEEARKLGFRQLYLTGGETFLLPELGELLEIAVPSILTTVLTNATLFKGKRRGLLERFTGEPNFSLQVSVDGGIPELHDAYRGPGSWKRAMEGVEIARNLGVRVRVGTTETPEYRGASRCSGGCSRILGSNRKII